MEVVHELDAARDEWRRLGGQSGNLFATWEWAETWWRHYGEGQPLVAIEPGEGIAALEVRPRGPLRVARFVGHGPADEMGPVGPAGGQALRALEQGRHWDVLLAERLPPGSGVRGTTLMREASPVVEAPGGGWEGYLKDKSRNFRSQVRRKERALLERGLTYRLSDDPALLEDDMTALTRLHEARWGEQGSGALAGRRVAFHLDFARVAQERGWLRLWLAEVDGSPVAAWYGFRFAGAEWYYQSGRDPDWEEASVGLVLLAHTIREAFDDGLTTYRLLRGGEAYKDRFATSDPGLETVVAGTTALGKAAERAAPAALKLRRALRRGAGAAPSTTPRPSG